MAKKCQIEFPLFDKGCIYLAQKNNEFNSAEQQKVILKDSSTLRAFRNYLESLSQKSVVIAGIAEFVSNFVEDNDEILDVLDEFADAAIVFKAMKVFVGFLDRKMVANDAEMTNELKDLKEQDEDGSLITEFLPKLFAKDLSHWLKTHGAHLIIFLDAYEKLTGEECGKKNTVRLFSENRDVPADWWVGELLSEVDCVMWVIAGRYKIEKIGDVDCSDGEQVANYTVAVFNNYWAKKYLSAGGVPEEFHAGLIELTGGHPYYLRKCIETYQNYQANNSVPTLKDFGKNRDDIVQATIGSLDEGGQFMAQCLCILHSWTDKLAAAAIANFNNVTYTRVKKQVARAERMNFGEVCTFDKTIDAFFFTALKNDVVCRKLFVDIRDRASGFFQEIFAAEKNPRKIYGAEDKLYNCFGVWSELILRTTDAPAELMTQYAKNLAPYVNRLDYATREIIVKKFLVAVGDAETLPAAYFQNQIGVIRLAQGKIKNALELTAKAYSTVKNLSPDKSDLPFKISVTTGHADVVGALKRCRDEITLREEILGECVRCFDKGDERIVDAMNNLAQALENGDKINAAIELRGQALKLLDGRDDEKFIHAARTYLKLLESREELDKFWYLENRSEELEHVRENLAARLQSRLDACDKSDEKTVELMAILAEVIRSYDWRIKLNDAIQQIVAECTAEPIADYDAAVSTLKNLLPYADRQTDLARKILALVEQKPAVDEAEIIAAKKDLALAKSADYNWWQNHFESDTEADKLFTEVEEYFRPKLPNSRKELAETLRAHAGLLNKFGNHTAALEKLAEMLALLESDSTTTPAEIFKTMCAVADANYHCKNFPEQLSWLERALKFCEENFVEDAPETLEALKNLVTFHECFHDSQENVDVYIALADANKAQEYQNRIDDIKSKNLGDTHTEVINAKKNLLRLCIDVDDEIALRKELDGLYLENFKATAAKKSQWQLYDDYMENIELILNHADNETYDEFYKRLGVECKEYLQEMFRADDFDLETFYDAINGQVSPLDSFFSHSAYHYEFEATNLLALEYVNLCRLENVHSAESIDVLLDLADFCYREGCEDEAAEAYRRIYEIARELSRRDPDFKYNFDLDFYERWADKEKVDNLRGRLLDRHRRFIEENREKLGENHFRIINHTEAAAKLLDALGRHEEAFKTRHKATILRATNPNVRAARKRQPRPCRKNFSGNLRRHFDGRLVGAATCRTV